MNAIVTLTTDFGLSDGYVGAMKGIVCGTAPDAQIVDISHLILPQDISSGAFVMYSACRFFPKGTVHVGVVDPGVGSDRRGIVVETDKHKYVGPDNGLFSPVFEKERVRRVVVIENPALMRPVVSATFHGRDIFASVGAHLANGISCEEVGTAIVDPLILAIWQPKRDAQQLIGQVVHIDHFGNAISMLSRDEVDAVFGGKDLAVAVDNIRFDRVCYTYSDVAEGEALALYGSLDTLEISVNGGSAAEVLGLKLGDEIRLSA